MVTSRIRRFGQRILVSLVVLAGLLAAPKLLAGWGFAASWDIVEDWGRLEQSDDWGIGLFGMSGSYEVLALGTDDDCNGYVDSVFVLGDAKKAEEVRSQLPTEEVALWGGVLTEKGWSGITFIDPMTYGDLVLLSYGDPPAGMNITAPIVMDIREPEILGMDKASPTLFKACGFLLAASQAWATRYEWDFDSDGLVDKVGYWGQNGPVFAGPVIPPQNRDLLIAVTDNNVPAKTATFIVGGNLPTPETLKPGDVVIPQSNMGFKLNIIANDEETMFSNMGFKLNYTLWQGGEHDPVAGTWQGPCNAWSMSSWALLPEPSPILPMVRFSGTGLCTAAAAFSKRTNGCEVNVVGSPELEEVSFTFSGSGPAALFYAENGWTCKYEWDFDSVAGGYGPAALALLDGERWSIEFRKEKEERSFASGGNGGDAGGGAVDYYLKMDGIKYMGSYTTVNFGEGAEETAWQWNRRDNTWMGLLADAEDREGLFIRGETNLDSLAGPDISDAVFILQWLFTGGREPVCRDSADVNDDGATDISDAVALLGHLFLGTAAPKAPYPNAGIDPTPDSIPCDLMD